MKAWKLEVENWKRKVGEASPPSRLQKNPRHVILSEAKDLLFVCSQSETADASLRSA
jgi:hypothetical protein